MKFRIEVTEDGSIRVSPIGPPGVTLEALKELNVTGELDRATFHWNGTSGDWNTGCYREYGPRGGISRRFELWRANGQLKTWVTRPTEFRLPLKHGLRSYGELTHRNAAYFHYTGDCPCEKLPNDREGLLALLNKYARNVAGVEFDPTLPSIEVVDLELSTGEEAQHG